MSTNGMNKCRYWEYPFQVEKFNSELIEQLKQKMPDIVYVYSQNSAVSFLNLIKKYLIYSK